MTTLRYYGYRAGIKAGDVLLWLGIAAFAYGFFKQSLKLCVAALIVLGINMFAVRILNGALKADTEEDSGEQTANS